MWLSTKFAALMIGRAIVLIPVWLVTMAALPFFPPTHPWKGTSNSLVKWAKHATPLSVAFGAGFWLLGAGLAFALWCYNHNRPEAVLFTFFFETAFVVWFFSKVDDATN